VQTQSVDGQNCLLLCKLLLQADINFKNAPLFKIKKYLFKKRSEIEILVQCMPGRKNIKKLLRLFLRFGVSYRKHPCKLSRLAILRASWLKSAAKLSRTTFKVAV